MSGKSGLTDTFVEMVDVSIQSFAVRQAVAEVDFVITFVAVSSI